VHVAGEDWEDRVAGWFAGTGMDVWAIQREVQDPLDYVRLWLADASEGHDPIRAAQWLDWFAHNNIEAVGFGVVTARLSGVDDPTVVCEDLRQQVEPPLGDRVASGSTGGTGCAATMRSRRATVSPTGCSCARRPTMGDEGWAVDRQLLALPQGLRWVEEIDPLILAMVSGCTGTLPMCDQLSLLAQAHEVPVESLEKVLMPVIDHLVERGMLIPCEP
jgi:hypothetical protein